MDTTAPLRFGPFELDIQGRTLRCAGQELRVRPRSFDVLVHLVRHRGRVVGKEELAEAVWAGLVVTDDSLVQCVRDVRLALASAAGAGHVANAGRVRLHDLQRQIGMREGFDIGLEMSGAPAAVAEMLQNMNHGGRVAMLGLPASDYAINWGRVITHMLTIKGIYGREMFETWYLMTSMLSTSTALKDAVRSVVTHTFPAEDWEEAFAVARSGDCGKVIMDWS